MSKLIVGWREWCRFPELRIEAIKAKIDTGATTSCLHAINIEPCSKAGTDFIKFDVHPIQRRQDIVTRCIAPLIDQRVIKDSGGHQELRYIIKTSIAMGSYHQQIEISLTARYNMVFRMLIGREALKNNLIVDVEESFNLGKLSIRQLKELYQSF